MIRLSHMDEAGIDVQVIALTAPGVQVFDADTAFGLAQEANDVLVEAVGKYPSRFAGLAAVAPQAPKTTLPENSSS
jgi:2,3-dihydroxybenzoate decarboxylase